MTLNNLLGPFILLCLVLSLSCVKTSHPPAGAPTLIYLDARSDWLSTGLKVTRGQKLIIKCRGKWAVAPEEESERWPDAGPDGHRAHPGEEVHRLGDPRKELPGTPFGTLLGKAGGVVFAIGDRREVIVPASGELYLVINDYPFYRHDNRGGLTIMILTDDEEGKGHALTVDPP